MSVEASLNEHYEVIHELGFVICPRCGFKAPDSLVVCWKCGKRLKR
jgi:DNA-directed RNA polymerase subunit RPC12/RpoP